MTKRLDDIAVSMSETRDRVDKIERHLETMQTVLMVREPNSKVAGDAYDGLRKQVVAAMSERIAHLTQLVQMALAVDGNASPEALRAMVESWFESAALLRISDVDSGDEATLFEIVEDLGGPLEVLAPAFVDGLTGRVMRMGRARRPQPVTSTPPPPPIADPILAPAQPTATEQD